VGIAAAVQRVLVILAGCQPPNTSAFPDVAKIPEVKKNGNITHNDMQDLIS
jgi:hypothetical protein